MSLDILPHSSTFWMLPMSLRWSSLRIMMEEALIVLVEVSKEPYATDHKLAASREWWEIWETKMGKMKSKSIEANFTSPAPENCIKLHVVTSKPSYPAHIENLVPQESSLAKLQHSIIFLRCHQCLPKPCKFLWSQGLDSFTGSFPQRVHHTQRTMTLLLML